eukprot:CAMPEP_0184860068 /NCGR_PEP_ID=MMETSP0580-20130426/5022_1 /TAXON_ID=1118495 /ORGANISM="Dactyliosolen fragilissimus" /LENGTH=171 /DNA_ID=CAMNT_0027357025 /DNA_START=27 /DNA_END=539 /DNA_ORIENTATION=-
MTITEDVKPHYPFGENEESFKARQRRKQILKSHRAVLSQGGTELKKKICLESAIVDSDAQRLSDHFDNSAVSSSGSPFEKAITAETVASSVIVPPRDVSNTKVEAQKIPKQKNYKKKQVQKRYDPDVPMSKEEEQAWRREQRRKRNRESAAASRQKQRDRIFELEAEVDDW